MKITEKDGIYHQEGSQIPKIWLTDEEHGKAIQLLITVSTDTVIVNRKNKTIYLAWRKLKPMTGWWVIGGKRNPGETPKQSIVRCFKRETGLAISEKRFQFLTQKEYIWSDRQQNPQDIGRHDAVHVFAIELTNKELSGIKLEKNEYEDGTLTEFTKEMLERNMNAEGPDFIHPALLRFYNLIFSSP